MLELYGGRQVLCLEIILIFIAPALLFGERKKLTISNWSHFEVRRHRAGRAKLRGYRRDRRGSAEATQEATRVRRSDHQERKAREWNGSWNPSGERGHVLDLGATTGATSSRGRDLWPRAATKARERDTKATPVEISIGFFWVWRLRWLGKKERRKKPKKQPLLLSLLYPEKL